MTETSPYDVLFTPVQIGPVTAPNRFYAVPHATGHGHTAPMGAIGLRAMKAEGGWGVVAAQITEIGPDADMANHPMDRLWDDSDIPIHALNVERVKEHGALAAIELGHGGMRARNLTTGLPVIGPSDLPVFRPEVPVQARAMSLTDIAAFRARHRQAALRAKQAGYDIIYVYAAHGLSIFNHFMSLNSNKRSDEYGGSLENRVRLLQEVLEDTREVVGGDCAVALRFAVHESGVDFPLTCDGEGRDVVEMLAELPDLWDVNISGWSSDSRTARFSEEGFQEDFVSFVREKTSKPIVGVGRYTSPDRMVRLVKSGTLDLIGAARPSIADPFLPTKIREGRVDEIRECIGCNICVMSDNYGMPVRCTQNPTIAEEWRRNWHPEVVPKGRTRKNVLIVGAGPAGLECAWTLARAGHKVTLAEGKNEPGGRAVREARLTGLSTWKRVADYRLTQISQHADVDLFLESEIDAGTVEEVGADDVVVATGGYWRRDGVGSSRFHARPFPDDLHVLTPNDIMDGETPDGPVLVYDDEHFYMGGVIAHHLARQGRQVVLATPLPEISAWTALTLEQPSIVRTLAEVGVDWRVNRALGDVGNQQAQLICSFTEDLRETVSFAHLVMVGARLPDNKLYQALSETIPKHHLWRAGDCSVPGIIQAAVYSGHRIARLIDGDHYAGASFRREPTGHIPS